ncbi:AAA family ATPase [Chitinophaga sp. Ak27]|uniref:AAA family ATPase n=1 Tax=Chitinophaga sp. Ak27 TaxID=2726116 RepID=UPI00145E4D4B|nr:AAA family ATPase [Chitinophaga sp. Ak27]NLU90432.1 AAA family ATPase [Chitinophaga sp. Ak27]
MKRAITSKNIYRQLLADLIGKDSYRGVTLTYSWLANQFGHFSLGFIPTFLFFLFLKKRMADTSAALWAASVISAIWLLFETFNFLGPLLLSKRGDVKKAYVFQPAWGNIAFDTVTDLLFFWFGAFTASLCCAPTNTALMIAIVLAIGMIYPAYYWYLTKMYLQTPAYPFQFRLSQWNTEKIPDTDVALVQRFLDNEVQGMHLFLFGPKRSGKTSLSVAIATELSIRHHAAVYTSAMKLYCMFFEQDEHATADTLWTWRRASILVIDDINPGHPIKEELISPERFLSFVDTFSTNDINRTVLKQTNVIWVLGDDDDARKLSERWKNMLHSIGVEKEKMLSLNLELAETPVC